MVRRILLALLCLLGSGTVFAEPYFAVQTGLKCMSCHVNPTGGGMRNEFGNVWGQTMLPANQIDMGADRWTGKVGKYVAIGTNLRASASFTDIPHEKSQSEFDLDEARLYVELNAIPDRLSIYFDQRIAPGGSTNLEAYGRYWWGNKTWYVQAGQMYLPYGLRLQDDTAFIREQPGINFATPDKGVQLGLETGPWGAQLAITNGTASGPEEDQGKQYSLRGEFVQSIFRVGASANFNDADSGDRSMANLFAGIRTGPIAWLAEADYIEDKGFAEGTRRQWAGLLEANWLIRQGHNLKLTAEYFDPDDAVDEDERTRWSAVYEYTPFQFLQLRVGARLYDGIPQNNLDNRTLAFAQVNAYF